MTLRFKYIGEGAWIPGVPARDLTDEDMAELGEATAAQVAANAALEAGAIYEAVGGKGRVTEKIQD